MKTTRLSLLALALPFAVATAQAPAANDHSCCKTKADSAAHMKSDSAAGAPRPAMRRYAGAHGIRQIDSAYMIHCFTL